MTRVLVLAAVLLAGCGGPEVAPKSDTPGARLEAAAMAQGLIVDPAAALLGGSWARDSDRMCVVGPERGEQRVGVIVDYGEGQGCSAAGRVRRDGGRLTLDFDRGCRFDARFEGDRIVFPAEVPDACSALCTGRATLAAVQVGRLSESASEARTLRGRSGEALCAGSS